MSKFYHLLLLIFCIFQVYIGFNIPFGIASVLFVGSGLGGLLGLYRFYYE